MAYSDARVIPFDKSSFGDDWNGLFIRGDDCILFGSVLRKMMDDSVCRFLLDPADACTINSVINAIFEDVLASANPKE